MVESVPIALQVPWRQSNKIMPTDGTNLVTLAAGGTTNAGLAPTKVFSVIASNNDTIAHDVILGITDHANLFTALGTVTCRRTRRGHPRRSPRGPRDHRAHR